jgi:hypothetical protein
MTPAVGWAILCTGSKVCRGRMDAQERPLPTDLKHRTDGGQQVAHPTGYP